MKLKMCVLKKRAWKTEKKPEKIEKILAETNFQPREFTRSGSKATAVKEEKKKSESQCLQWSVPVAWTNFFFDLEDVSRWPEVRPDR